MYLFSVPTDVGCPSVCVLLYWLMNKAVLANDLAEGSQVGNLNRDKEREWAELGKCHVAAKGHVRTLEPYW